MESEGDDPKCSKIQIFKMEFEGDDPKRRKPIYYSLFPLTSMQDSIPTLPPELITDIFSRLPVKSLVKFRNIYSFDLADEKWRKTVEQPSYRGGGLVSWLTVLASDLSIFFKYEETHLDVWVMKEYGIKESWTMMFTIKCPGDEVEICHLRWPLFFMSKKGEILVVMGSINMIYNPKDESIRYSELITIEGDYEGEIYVESLVSPFLTEECKDATTNKRLKNRRSRKSNNKNIEWYASGRSKKKEHQEHGTRGK